MVVGRPPGAREGKVEFIPFGLDYDLLLILRDVRSEK